jgi:DNA-binding Xre family transcriptional regulator
MKATVSAYSALPEMLRQRRLSVADIYRRLQSQGLKFDKKTLYRLASPEPMQTINIPVIGALCRELNVALGDLISFTPRQPKLHRIDEKTQKRLDELMTRNTEGKLTARERKELEELGEAVERLSFENAQLLARHNGAPRRAHPRRPAIARAPAKRPAA